MTTSVPQIRSSYLDRWVGERVVLSNKDGAPMKALVGTIISISQIEHSDQYVALVRWDERYGSHWRDSEALTSRLIPEPPPPPQKLPDTRFYLDALTENS